MIGGMATRTASRTPPIPTPSHDVPPGAAPPAANVHDAAAELLGDPVLGPGFDRIVHTTFKIDPFLDFALVEKALDPKGNDPAVLIDALDHAETAARTAHRLLVNAQLAYDQAKGEIATSESALRNKAREELEALKAAGDFKKAITNDDVESEMARRYPVDIAANRTRLLKAKGTVEHLERMADLTKLRIRTLDTLVSAARR